MDIYQKSLEWHEKNKGKLSVVSKNPIETKEDLSIAYTPGVAEPCRAIAANPDDVFKYTIKQNTVAVITDGSAVLGLGNIGPEASLPVMEGKCALFKEFADVDAFPIALKNQDVEQTIATIRNIAPVFGGINLEDFKAPECFAIEAALQDLGIPVMHDDQHGTAVVVLAGVINALKVVGKNIEDVRLVTNGAGAAGIAVTKLLMSAGLKGENVYMLDSRGIIAKSRDLGGNKAKESVAGFTNPESIEGDLAKAVEGADIFIGLSVKDALNQDMVRSMAKDSIVIAMANPEPEIMPDKAKEAGAAVVATGRSDFANQVNNVLAFPGIFRGALDIRATRITEEMKMAAAKALAGVITHPTAEEIIPYATDKSVVPAVAEAVKQAWKDAQ